MNATPTATPTATEMAQRLQKHAETVTPGLPASLTGANSPGDTIAQGDLQITLVDRVPEGYERVEHPTDDDRQLVPMDGSPGSNHRIESLEGVELWRPPGWGQNPADLRGPVLVIDRPNRIVHEPGHGKPHGTVELTEPMTVACTYQRNLSQDERAMRARD